MNKPLLCILIFFVMHVYCSDWYLKGNPQFATEQNIQQLLLDKTSIKIFKFFTPWCRYCRYMKPTVDKFHGSMIRKGRNDVKFYQVNCDEQAHICNAFKVKSYPTIKIVDFDGNLGGEVAGYYEDQSTLEILNGIVDEITFKFKKDKAVPVNQQEKLVKVIEPEIKQLSLKKVQEKIKFPKKKSAKVSKPIVNQNVDEKKLSIPKQVEKDHKIQKIEKIGSIKNEKSISQKIKHHLITDKVSLRRQVQKIVEEEQAKFLNKKKNNHLPNKINKEQQKHDFYNKILSNDANKLTKAIIKKQKHLQEAQRKQHKVQLSSKSSNQSNNFSLDFKMNDLFKVLIYLAIGLMAGYYLKDILSSTQKRAAYSPVYSQQNDSSKTCSNILN